MAALFTWYKLGSQNIAGSSAANIIIGIKALIDDDVSSNPSTCMWEVAHYNTNWTIILKPTINNIGVGPTARIAFFGNSLPNAAAVSPLAANNLHFYNVFAPTAGVDTPDNAFTAGKLFNTGEYLVGDPITSFTNQALLDIFVCEAGVILVPRITTPAGATGAIWFVASGDFGLEPDGNTVMPLSGGCNAGLNGNACGEQSSYTDTFFSPARRCAAKSTLNVSQILVSRCINITLDQQYGLIDGTRYKFLPIPLREGSTSKNAGSLRQMAFGPTTFLGAEVDTASASPGAIAISNSTTQGATLWLTNFQV